MSAEMLTPQPAPTPRKPSIYTQETSMMLAAMLRPEKWRGGGHTRMNKPVWALGLTQHLGREGENEPPLWRHSHTISLYSSLKLGP